MEQSKIIHTLETYQVHLGLGHYQEELKAREAAIADRDAELERVAREQDTERGRLDKLNAEVEVENGRHVLEGGEVFPTFHVSLFGGQLFETTSCQRCPPREPKPVDFSELYLSLPEKDPPARSVASPPRNKSHGSQTDKSDGDNKIQTTAEGSTSPISGSGLGDGAMEKTPKPLQVGKSMRSCSQLKRQC